MVAIVIQRILLNTQRNDARYLEHLIIWTAPKGQVLPDTSTSENCSYYAIIQGGIPYQIRTEGFMPFDREDYGSFTR